MGVEIERKFLVRRSLWASVQALSPVQASANRMDQGYLSQGLTTVRVRITSRGAFLTIKGPEAGGIRSEFEYSIPSVDASSMLDELAQSRLTKTRYLVEFGRGDGKRLWEVDVFEGSLAGLIVAEVELPDLGASVDLPPWVGPEVTEDPRFRNSSLAATAEIPVGSILD